MKSLLFDFGGTIDTDGVHWSEKFWELYERFNVNVIKKDFERAFVQAENEIFTDQGLPQAMFYQTLHKQLILQLNILKIEIKSDLLNEMKNFCYTDVSKTIARAREILIGFRTQFNLGLVSNFYGNLEIVCKEFQLDSVFSVMVDSVVVGIKKPDPAIFKYAIEKLNSSPRETCVIGDSYDRDIVPAKQLGCRTIWLKGKSWMIPQSTNAADATITKFSQVPAAVASLM
jgi:HAD superfamily hydrolase (TIGR01549 family)